MPGLEDAGELEHILEEVNRIALEHFTRGREEENMPNRPAPYDYRVDCECIGCREYRNSAAPTPAPIPLVPEGIVPDPEPAPPAPRRDDVRSHTCATCDYRGRGHYQIDGHWHCNYCVSFCDRCTRPAVTAPMRTLLNILNQGSRICASCIEADTTLVACGHSTCNFIFSSTAPTYTCYEPLHGRVCAQCREYRQSHSCPGCTQRYCAFNREAIDRHQNCPRLFNYSYTPVPLTFNGTGPVYLGMELEVNAPSNQWRQIAETGSIYCKEDGSVNGFEIVTHPMSYDWAMENFPWHKFGDLYRAGCRPGNNGLHVHISRAGFTDEAHVLRWMLLVYRNQSNMIKFSRRNSSQWASFNDADECERKAYGDQDGRRYVAINAQNDATYEVRLFRSSLSVNKVQGTLGFVDASCEYTRTLSNIDALSLESRNVPADLAWPKFAEWVREIPKYAPLYNQMRLRETLT